MEPHKIQAFRTLSWLGMINTRLKALWASPEQTAMYLENRMLASFRQVSCCRVKHSQSGCGRKSAHLASEAGPWSCGLWSSAPGVVFRESWNDKPATLVDGFMT